MLDAVSLLRADTEIVPPMQFQWYWVPIGILLLLLIAAWYFFIPVIARRAVRRVAPPVPYQRPYQGPAGAAQRAFEAIAVVEQQASVQAITVREAHLRFSAIVREFAWDMTRVDARTMTLTELRATGLTTIATAVAQFYPIAFQEEELLQLGSAADVARGAVASWN